MLVPSIFLRKSALEDVNGTGGSNNWKGLSYPSFRYDMDECDRSRGSGKHSNEGFAQIENKVGQNQVGQMLLWCLGYMGL